MRAALALAVLGTAAVVDAAPARPPIVWKNQVRRPPPGTAAAQISNVLYLNDCRPNGCTVQPGFDDSRQDRSSIAVTQTTLDAWAHGDALWDELVDCVRTTFLPFDVEVVTTDPGAASHFEVMVAGRSAQLHPELMAGGVAPFVSCGATDDNVISFVFAAQTTDLEFLCGAVAQEAAHVWGLDHELNALDPMTYLDLGSLKRFQNDDAACGEELASPRECWCGGTTQNSYQYLTQLFGGAPLPPATLAISTPIDGQWVEPGFPVRAELTSVLGATTATLSIDGSALATLSPGPFAFNAPVELSAGAHTVEVRAADGGGRQVAASVAVNVMAACANASCAEGFACLGGSCHPDANVPGGLGAACTRNEDCSTGRCVDGSGDHRCAASCDPGHVCPAGFACLDADLGAGTCWPARDDGGCAASGDRGGAAFVLGGLGLLALRRRRRR